MIQSGRARFPDSLGPLLVPINSVQQFPGNPNNGDLDELLTSIDVNGFITAVTVDKKTGYILAGNHRWQALHALGAEHIPVIWAEQALDGGKRYLIADNQIGSLARMDEHALVQMLQDLQNTELGLIGTGFDAEALDRLLIDLSTGGDIPVGGGFDVAPNGIYQVVVEFETEDQRDELFADLAGQYDKVRTVNL